MIDCEVPLGIYLPFRLITHWLFFSKCWSLNVCTPFSKPRKVTNFVTVATSYRKIIFYAQLPGTKGSVLSSLMSERNWFRSKQEKTKKKWTLRGRCSSCHHTHVAIAAAQTKMLPSNRAAHGQGKCSLDGKHSEEVKRKLSKSHNHACR